MKSSLIMPRNVLFHFIDLYLEDGSITFPHCDRFKKDTSQQGCHYYHFDLKHYSKCLRDETHQYQLQDHHVSVYETESERNPFLSQYHYTAYFEDENQRKYRAHVYFNDKHDTLIKPVFSIRLDDKEYTTIDSEKLNDDLVHLASRYAMPIIKLVRKQSDLKVKELEKRYKFLEAEASKLSLALPESAGAYTIKLKEINETLTELNPLVHHKTYEAIQKIIAHIQCIAKEGYLVKPLDPEEKSTGKIDHSSASESPQKVLFEERAENPDPTISHSKFDKEILELSRHSTILTGNDEADLQNLNELLAKVYSLSLILDNDRVIVSLESLATLKRLNQTFHDAGEKLFMRLVIGRKYTLAERLSPFYYLLDNYLDLALQTRNSALLDFVLKYGEININNREVNVKGILYPSALASCFASNNEENPMAECFSILLKHGASVLSINEEGIPIAHSILSASFHPFQKVLCTEYPSKTITSIRFYRQLIIQLRQVLEEKTISETMSKEILSGIDTYGEAIKQLKSGTTPSINTKFLAKESLDFIQKHKTPTLERLKQDPEFIALSQRVNQELSEYLKRLTPTQRITYTKQRSDFIKDLDQSLEALGIKFDDYDYCKEMGLQYLNDSLKTLQKRIELADIQTSIRGYATKSGKATKKYKQLMKQQGTLVAEINELNSTYSLSSSLSLKQVLESNPLLTSSVQIETEDERQLVTEFQSLVSKVLKPDEAKKFKHAFRPLFSALLSDPGTGSDEEEEINRSLSFIKK